MTKYIYPQSDAKQVSKHGISLRVYGAINEDISFSCVSVEEGHLEEFKSTSWFVYYVIHGSGVFVLNDERVAVKAGDVVAIPPNTRIHYFGKMELTLTVTPPWKPENEVHIRNVDPSENPFLKL